MPMDHPDWDTAIWQLLADLWIDRVLALSQVRRRYAPGAREDEVGQWVRRLAARQALSARRVWVPRTARARLTEELVAVELPGRPSRQEEIAHRLGLAEMRWRLRPGVLRWQVIGQLWPERGQHGERPDALAEDAAGPFVVEYDHGAYSASDVRRKHRAFADLAPRQVWGVSAERRRRWLRERLDGADVLVAVW
jgi:hypothetical protein